MVTWPDDAPDTDADRAFAPVKAIRDDLREAGTDSVRIPVRFALHLSAEANTETGTAVSSS